MSSTVYNWFAPLRKPLTQRQSVLLVFVCTFIGAAAQILMKLGANRLPAVTAPTVALHLPAIILNYHLWAGLSLYGLFTALLLLALRDGELSILYPVIALNYVWVTFLSMALFKETLNPFKALGITAIVVGVVILGRGSKP